MAGGRGNDVIRGGANNDVLSGGQGGDFLLGGSGDDFLKGGTRSDESGGASPNDNLDGGAGNDRLYGGYGHDVLTAGAGSDRFIFRAVDDSRAGEGDFVNDFEQGSDMLVFRRELRSGGALHFIGSSDFSGAASEVRFESADGTISVQIDIDGDTKIDMAIGFAGEIQFQASDFSF